MNRFRSAICYRNVVFASVVVIGSVSIVVADDAADGTGGFRTWNDRSGFFTIEANLQGIGRGDDGATLKLRKTDGRVIEVPYKLFSDADVKWAADWFREHKNDPPPPRLPMVGDRIQLQSSSRWYKGEVVAIDGLKYEFKYDNYSSSWNEWKTAEFLRWEDGTAVIPGGPADPDVVAAAEAAKTPESKPQSKPEPPAMVTPPVDTTDDDAIANVDGFPSGLSPTQTMTHLRTQIERGNLAVVWDWLPDDTKRYLTSESMREHLKVIDSVKADELGPSDFLRELAVVLKTKKSFVLASPITMLLLEDQASVDDFAKVYDPAVDAFDQAVDWLSSVDAEMRGESFEADVRARCDRMAPIVKTLFASASAEQLASFWDRIVVAEASGGGTLTLVYPTGQKKLTPLTNVDGRWMPTSMVDSLGQLPEGQRKLANEIASLSKPRREGRIDGFKAAAAFKIEKVQPIIDAFRQAAASNDQTSFDAAIQSALVALQAAGYLG